MPDEKGTFRIEIQRVEIGPQHHPKLDRDHDIFQVRMYNGDSIWIEELKDRDMVSMFLRGAEAYARLHGQYFTVEGGW